MTNKKQPTAIATSSKISRTFGLLATVIFFSTLWQGCSKAAPEPELDLSDYVRGSYNFTEMKWGPATYKMPYKEEKDYEMSASARVIKLEEDKVNFVETMVYIYKGVKTTDEMRWEYKLKKLPNGDIAFFNFLEQSPIIYNKNENKLTYDWAEDDNGQRIYLIGKKQ